VRRLGVGYILLYVYLFTYITLIRLYITQYGFIVYTPTRTVLLFERGIFLV